MHREAVAVQYRQVQEQAEREVLHRRVGPEGVDVSAHQHVNRHEVVPGRGLPVRVRILGI